MKPIKLTSLFLASAFTIFTAASCNDDANGVKTDADTTKIGMQDSQDTAQDANAARMGDNMEDDASFVTKAAASNMAEIEAHKSASSKAINAEVKKAAKEMLTDHEKLAGVMKQYASSKNITLPAAPDNSAKEDLAELNKKTGADYDKAYINMMADDHKDDIDFFEKNKSNRTDPELNKIISETIPTLRKHQDMVKAIKDKM